MVTALSRSNRCNAARTPPKTPKTSVIAKLAAVTAISEVMNDKRRQKQSNADAGCQCYPVQYDAASDSNVCHAKNVVDRSGLALLTLVTCRAVTPMSSDASSSLTCRRLKRSIIG